MTLKRIAALCACYALLAIASFGQTTDTPPKPATTPTFQAGSEEVVLDVVVRDKKGHLVKDLKPEDFQLFDNGQKRAIKQFRLVEGSESISSAGARTQLDPLRQIRLITLLFHGLDQNGRLLARQAALDMIKTDLAQNVYISVLIIDHALEALQPFTNDRNLLRKAIEHATGGTHEFADDSARIESQLQQLMGPSGGGPQGVDAQAGQMSNGASGSSGAAGAPSGGAAADQAMAQMMLSMLNASRQDSSTDIGRSTIYSLLDAVKEQYRLPGRKTILLFSSGFTIPQAAEQAFHTVISTANRSNVSFYAIDARGLATSSTNNDAMKDLDGATAASRRNATPGVTVTRDMARSEDRSIESGRADTQNSLGVLAQETGGELIANTNDLRTPLRKLGEELQTYYEITYDPHIENYDGSFRKISIKTDQANLRVQSRSGYFALPPSMTAKGQVVQPFEVPLLEALNQKPLRRDFSFQATGMHFRSDAGASTCELVLDVPISSFNLQQNKAVNLYEGKFGYVALVKDTQGQILMRFRGEVPLRITPDKLEAYKASHFVYTEGFQLPPGRYTLESGILDTQGEKLSARKSSFMLPAQGSALSISSISVVRTMKPADQNANGKDPLFVQNQLITPSLNPVVKKSDADGLPFYAVVYRDNTKADKPALQIEFSKDGQVLARLPAPLGDPDAEGRIKFMTTVPLAKMDPGDYQVRFIAKQGDEAAVESTTFNLQP